jgi:glycosyltransferase involved in cell wall biosynthesis
LLHVFPTFAVGGAQMRFASLANRFGRQWRHAIIALDGVTDCRARLAPNLDVSFPVVTLDKGNLLGNVRRIRPILRRLRPSVLVTSNWGSIEWAIANLLPLARHIHTEDGFGPEERYTQLPRRVWMRRMALRHGVIVLPSQTLLRIATDIWRLNPKRLRYIPNGVDLARYAVGDRPTTGMGQGGARPVIGIVAALRPEKNLGRLLRAFHLAITEGAQAGWRLVIVGEGSERPALEALTRQLGIAEHVTFAGYIAEPAEVYAQFDIFTLSSDTEQMPLSVLEAMAAGLPVVSTDVGDVRAMLAPENGEFVVPAEDAAMASALRALMADQPLRRALGHANRQRAERVYDQEVMFQAYATLLNGTNSGRSSH